MQPQARRPDRQQAEHDQGARMGLQTSREPAAEAGQHEGRPVGDVDEAVVACAHAHDEHGIHGQQERHGRAQEHDSHGTSVMVFSPAALR